MIPKVTLPSQAIKELQFIKYYYSTKIGKHKMTYEQERLAEWLTLMIGNGWEYVFRSDIVFNSEYTTLCHKESKRLFEFWKTDDGYIVDPINAEVILQSLRDEEFAYFEAQRVTVYPQNKLCVPNL